MSGQDLPKRPKVTPAYPEKDLKIPVRTCPRCGGQAVVHPEGLLQCYNCKFTWQSCGMNYRILRNR